METLELSNPELEQQVIGELMIDPSVYWTTELLPEAFSLERNRLLFQTIVALIKRKIHPDIMVLEDELKRLGILETCGGLSYIMQVLAKSATSLYYEQHAEIIMRHYRRRKVLSALQDGAQEIISDQKPIESIIQETTEKIVKTALTRKGTEHIKIATDEVFEEIEQAMKDPREIRGVKTGIVDLDKAIGGFHATEGELIYLAGEPGVGKTILASQICANLAHPSIGDTPGVIFSLEMNKRKLTKRILSHLTKVSASKIESGFLTDSEFSAIINGCEELYSMPLYISDNGALTLPQLRAEMVRRMNDGAKWFMLDYLQRINGFERLDNIERTERISQELSNICKDLKVGGIVINSVTKDVMDGELPTKKSVRGSGQLLHDADVVMFIVRKKDVNLLTNGQDNLRTVLIEKNRNNKSKLSFDLIMIGDGVMSFGCVEKRKLLE